MSQFFELCDRQFARNAFVAGASFSTADITSFVAIEVAKRGEITIPAECGKVARWHDEIASRTSARA